MSERYTKRRSRSRARNSQVLSRFLAGTTRVVSPLKSITSATACESQSLSFCATAFFPASFDSTLYDSGSGGRLFIPVQCAFFPEVNVPDEQNDNVEQHLHKAKNFQILVDQRPWVEKDRLD